MFPLYISKFSIVGANHKFVIPFLISGSSKKQITQTDLGSSSPLELINSMTMSSYFPSLNLSCIIFKMKILPFTSIIKEELLLLHTLSLIGYLV